jgi:sphingomyelin phosphodiesterase acid-like 3
MPRFQILVPTLAAPLLIAASLPAQTPAPRRASTPATKPAAKAPTTIPALLLSDIHLDPFHDPHKVAQLNTAPASEWPAILAAPDLPTQAKDYDQLQAICPVRGLDTSYTLWQSSLQAIHRDAAQAKFVTISGDLLAHAFDCKYKVLVPAGTHADYLAFVEKTIRTVVAGLRTALPSVPVYVGMGNNDSGCGDYALDPNDDAFLASIAPIVADALAPGVKTDDPARATILADFKQGGYFNAPLPASIPNTRIVSVDDIYASNKFTTCSKRPDISAAAAQMTWLTAQLDAARAAGQIVWVLGHIPPGVDLYSTARKQPNLCEMGQPDMFLSTEKIEDVLAAYPDTVHLALFGHTHSDEMRLLLPETPATPDQPATSAPTPGVPLKITASITAVNGNNPSFTLAQIDPATATLADYTVVMASNQTGVGTTWSKAYTYSTTYQEPDFSGASLADLISKLKLDVMGGTPASQAYLHNYFPGDRGSHAMILGLVWPQYVCSMNHDSAKAFAACVCGK